MIENATGIILRTRPLTETSLIVNWLTPNLGRIATVAKGARRARSPFAGKLDLFYTAEFSFRRSRVSELHQLREVKLLQTRRQIRDDMAKLQQAAYASAWLELTTETQTPLPEIFQLVQGFLETLAHHPPSTQNIFTLELSLLREFGLEPDWPATRLTAGTQKIAVALVTGDWENAQRLKLSEAQANELGLFLQNYLTTHFGRIPRGRLMALSG